MHTITRKPHPITTIPLTILTALLLVGALLFILGAGGPTTAQAASDDITVCPDGSCDYTSIGGAVAAADPDDNILVQAGTYTETDITLNKNLSIIGEGAESTIVQAAATPGTASGRVFKVNAGITASIEGMTIRYGNKTGTSETDSGGAIYTQGDLSLSAVIVVSNTTQARGGGIANNGGTLNINDSTISGNTASDGGGINNYNHAELVMTESWVFSNTADSLGGGIYSNYYGVADIDLTVIERNQAGNGGGMHNDGHSKLTLDRSTFLNNTASVGNGGAIYNYYESKAELTNSTISGNSANSGNGGGIYNFANTNHTVYITLTHLTVADNAANSGGGLYNDGFNGSFSIANLRGSLLADNDNGGDCVSNYAATLNDLGGNLVEDNSCGFSGGSDPKLGPLTNNGGSSPTHNLGYGSPAIDTITSLSCTLTIDQRGIDRPKLSGCDSGAVEAVSEAWVDDDWTGQDDVDAYNPELIWMADAFNSVAAGVEAVAASTVHVLNGTYTETLTLDKPVDIIGEDGAANTIIQAAGTAGVATSRVFTITDGVSVTLEGITIRYGKKTGTSETDNGGAIYNQGDLSLSAVIVVSNTAQALGGGIANNGGSLNINDSTISGNTASDGGGINNYDHAELVMTESWVFNNTADGLGGGIYSHYYSVADIDLTVIERNQAGNGGGMHNDGHSKLTLDRSTFLNNTASTGNGGAIYNYYESKAVLTNSTISGNSANSGNGGGIYNFANTNHTVYITLTHVTVADNAANSGGGLYNDGFNVSYSIANLRGSLLADNDSGGDCVNNYFATLSDLGGNLVEDNSCGFSGGSDPKLGPLADNGGETLTHALLPGSPAIDAIPTAKCTANADQRDKSRPFGLGCDVGAFELDAYTTAISKSVDTDTPEPVQTITFTIIISNTGPGLNGGEIHDDLPTSLNFIGPVSIEPTSAGTAGSKPPAIASNLVISANHKVTVTFPVSIPFGIIGNTEIENMASFSNTAVITPVVSSVSVRVANVAPLALDDSGPVYSTTEDDAFITGNVLSNDSDSNGDELTLTSYDLSTTHGSVTDNGDGTFGYDPDGQFEALEPGQQASDTFTYIVSDGTLTDTATVTITITGVNDHPSAVNDGGTSFTTDEDTPFTTGSVLGNDSDPESDPLSISIIDISGTMGVVTDLGDGTFSYDPGDQFEGLAVGESDTDTFSYTVSDGNGGSDTATVTITITGVNDDPVAVDDGGAGFSTTANAPFTTGSVLDNDSDPDGDTLSITGIDTSGTTGSVTDNGDSTFSYDPNGQFDTLAMGESDTDIFSYTISDGNKGSDTTTVTITITGEAPEGFVIYLPMVLR